jgi:O-antigen ligase
LAGILIAVALILGTVATVWFLPPDWWARVSTTRTQIETGDIALRGAIWKTAAPVFLANPSLGVGLGGFEYYVSVGGKPRVAHNVAVAIAVQTGMIGFSLFAVFFWRMVRKVYRSSAGDRRLLLLVLAVWGIGAMVLSWEYRKSTWFMFALACSVEPARRIRASAGGTGWVPDGTHRNAHE